MAAKGWKWVVALAGLFAPGDADAQWLPPADCGSLSIHLAGIPEASGARCQGDEKRWNELIDASGPDRSFVIRHQSSGLNDYLQREEVTQVVKKLTAAAKLEGVSQRFKLGHFDVALYMASANTLAQPAACFGFLSYAGHVAQTTGYRHAIIGSYCDLTGKEPTLDRIRELLGGISADFW